VLIFEEEDEALVETALAGDVFTFITNCIIANTDFHREVDAVLCTGCFIKNNHFD